jgi:two-component system, NarL family, nitrate/nitrite response regulator NarL
MSTRVLIADDHIPTRTIVRKVLEAEGFQICAEAGAADSAVEAARRERPDICLLDVHMPGSGITAAAAIKAGLPDTAIVMLTVSPDEQDESDSMAAGATGYLLKGMDPARLGDALRKVL